MPNFCPTCGGEFADDLKLCPEDGTLLQEQLPLLPRAPVSPIADVPAPAYGGPPPRLEPNPSPKPDPIRMEGPFPMPAYGGPMRRAAAIQRQRPVYALAGIIVGLLAGAALGQLCFHSTFGTSFSALILSATIGTLGWIFAGLLSRS